MRVAYADPPYPGQARRHYHDDEINHQLLISCLCESWPDGWALSTSSTALQDVLAMCPPDVRVGAWVKPFAIFKPNVNPGYTWEPVIYWRGRAKRSRKEPTVRDYVSANITLRKGMCGAKPHAFNIWLFDMLGLQYGDTFDDLFPGSGAVSESWEQWQTELLRRYYDSSATNAGNLSAV